MCHRSSNIHSPLPSSHFMVLICALKVHLHGLNMCSQRLNLWSPCTSSLRVRSSAFKCAATESIGWQRMSRVAITCGVARYVFDFMMIVLLLACVVLTTLPFHPTVSSCVLNISSPSLPFFNTQACIYGIDRVGNGDGASGCAWGGKVCF